MGLEALEGSRLGLQVLTMREQSSPPPPSRRHINRYGTPEVNHPLAMREEQLQYMLYPGEEGKIASPCISPQEREPSTEEHE